MKVSESKNGVVERESLIGLIISKEVLGTIASRYKSDLYASRWSNLIARWCVEYYKQYNSAPGRAIESIFAAWSETTRDKEAVRLVEDFLGSLSGEYSRLRKELNADHIIDVSGKLFRETAFERLADGIKDAIAAGKIDEAQKLYDNFQRIELGAGTYIDMFSDLVEVDNAFSDLTTPIIQYPKPMQRFLRGSMERGGFISFIAPNKTGKSFVLEDLAWRAHAQRKRVAYFQVGDMSKRQVLIRFASRAAAHPYRSPTGKWPCELHTPTKLISVPEFETTPGYAPDIVKRAKTFKHPLDNIKARTGFIETQEQLVKSKNSYFRLWCYPTITVPGIKEELQRCENKEWIPDVVVIDYADNLTPSDRRMDKRDQINDTWLQLSALRLEKHYLIVTATQANKNSFKGGLLTRDNITDDRRKLDHVTGMIGLNVSSDDKKDGIARWNWVNLRDGDFSEKEVCWVAGCLGIVNPCVRSMFRGESG